MINDEVYLNKIAKWEQEYMLKWTPVEQNEQCEKMFEECACGPEYVPLEDDPLCQIIGQD